MGMPAKNIAMVAMVNTAPVMPPPTAIFETLIYGRGVGSPILHLPASKYHEWGRCGSYCVSHTIIGMGWPGVKFMIGPPFGGGTTSGPTGAPSYRKVAANGFSGVLPW